MKKKKIKEKQMRRISVGKCRFFVAYRCAFLLMMQTMNSVEMSVEILHFADTFYPDTYKCV